MAKRFPSGGGAHLVYNIVLGCALLLASPFLVPYVLSAGKRRKNLLERLGCRWGGVPVPSGRERVWIHAVSVGETLSAASLLRHLRRLRPSAELLLSTVTITGQEAAGKVLGGQIDGRFYFPIDLPGICARFLDRVRPDAVVIIETEIWPNFIAECAKREIPVVLLNGRISDRSYRRYRIFRFLFSRVLGCLSVISTQTEEDARRFRTIGAVPDLVAATGNMKFDVSPPRDADLSPVHAWMVGEKRKGTLWFVAGSTHEGEEEAVLSAFREARSVNGAVRLVLAPRHPERFDAVLDLCAREGWVVARKTQLAEGPDGSPVVLLDTVGELLSAYAAADVAFVGGSLVPKGGHNILEPALYGVPTFIGPNMQNFQEIADLFVDARAVERVRDAAEFSKRLALWAADPGREAGTGRRARDLLDAFRGAAERNAGILLRELDRKKAGAR